MRVLGIDPGSITTGYGIVTKGRDGRLTYVCDGEISASREMPLAERLVVISRALNDIIARFMPDAVAVESVFFSKNVKSAIMLGHVRGVALLSAASQGIDVFEYSPSHIKQAVTGYGGASKKEVQKMVGLLLGQTPSQRTDATDALAVAICHIHHSGRLPRLHEKRTHHIPLRADSSGG